MAAVGLCYRNRGQRLRDKRLGHIIPGTDCDPCSEAAVYEYYQNIAGRHSAAPAAAPQLPTGAVICTAELVNVWHIVYNPGTDVDVAKNIPIGAESLSKDKHAPDFHDYIVPTAQEMALGDWTPGRYAWELRNIKLLPEPIPAKGQQGLWNWEPPEEVLA